MKGKQPSNRDLKNGLDTVVEKLDAVVEAIVAFADDTQKRFERIDKEIGGLQTDAGVIRREMVTKDFLEEKLGDLRGDLTGLTRKEDRKVMALVGMLHRKKVLTKVEAKSIAGVGPFPTLSLT